MGENTIEATALPAMPDAPADVYRDLGVRPVINACGIYTDLGGSTLEPEVWDALASVNFRWASMLDLLDRSGERIASLVGSEAARVVPGASAGIALAIAACIADGDPALIESLPDRGGRSGVVLVQRAHRYKYARCARLGGGVLRESGGEAGTGAEAFEQALATGEVAAILHPAHLEDADGSLRLQEVVGLARRHDVPVIVDAAYQVYPTDLIGSYARRGADLTCISSKYYFGPNAGGFVAGRRDLVDRIAALDFTEFESGPLLTFGRVFKLDRTTVAATAMALERWLRRDHDERWASYRRRAEALKGQLEGEGLGQGSRTCCFTFSEEVVEEPVNALLVPVTNPAEVARRLAAGSPAVRGVDLPEGVLFCMECVADHEVDGIASAFSALGA